MSNVSAIYFDFNTFLTIATIESLRENHFFLETLVYNLQSQTFFISGLFTPLTLSRLHISHDRMTKEYGMKKKIPKEREKGRENFRISSFHVNWNFKCEVKLKGSNRHIAWFREYFYSFKKRRERTFFLFQTVFYF